MTLVSGLTGEFGFNAWPAAPIACTEVELGLAFDWFDALAAQSAARSQDRHDGDGGTLLEPKHEYAAGQTQFVPDDALFSQQWHLSTYASAGDSST